MVSRANPDKSLKSLGWKASCVMEDVAKMMVEAQMESMVE
jgi:GDP-D-mannose dehydratase